MDSVLCPSYLIDSYNILLDRFYRIHIFADEKNVG